MKIDFKKILEDGRSVRWDHQEDTLSIFLIIPAQKKPREYPWGAR